MRFSRAPVLVTLLVCGISAVSRSQGFQVNEIGSCAVARGLAVTGSPCKDPSNIYWNPAATASLEGWSAYVGMAAIAVRGGFTADTSRRTYDADAPVAFPANVFVNYGAKGGRWALGLGAYVPFGLTSQWSTDFPGRFEALRASLTSIYVQPNFAYRIARGWSIGGGPVIGYSQVQLRQSLDLAQQDAVGGITFGQLGLAARTEFARAKLAGSATAFGFNIGVHGELGPDWEVGARYLSSLDFHYNNADATFGQILTNLVLPAGNPLGVPGGTPLDGILSGQFLPGAALSAQHVSTRIKHPAQFQVGLGYSGFVNSRISGDFEWTQFSSFTALPVTFSGPASVENRSLIEDYTNSWSLRFGVEHAFPVGIKGRIGFSYVSSPAPDISVSPLIPDMNRRNYTIGFGVPLSPRYTLDAGYLHVNTSGRRGRVVENSVSTAGPVPDGGGNTLTAQDLNSGFYTLSANVLSLSIRANF